MSRLLNWPIRAAIALLALLFSSPLWGQGGNAVSLYFTVEDGDRLIGGLTEQNFRLYEDGQPRDFHLAEPESPILISLLIEYSQASGLYLSDIDEALRTFLDLAPEGNWYSLASFSQELQIHVDFTKQKGKILASYTELGQPFWGEVNTYDAIFEMLERLEFLPGRKVLIVIGSGLNTLSRHNLDDVYKKSEAVNVAIFGVAAGSLLRGQYDAYLDSGSQMQLKMAEVFFNALAKKSGGQAFFPRFESAYRDAMNAIVLLLQNQYRLVYESRLPADGKFHRLKLEAFQIVNDKRRNFTVRVREGWRRNF